MTPISRMVSLNNNAQGRARWPALRRAPGAKALGFSLAFVLAAAGTGSLMTGFTPPGSLALIFLVAVLFSAVTFGFWTGISAAVFAFFAYNFFFVEPFFTLRVSRPEDFLALGVFMLVAALTGILAGRLREQADAAQERARLLEHLSNLSSELGTCTSEQEACAALLRGLEQLTGAAAILVDETKLSASIFEMEDLQAAERALRRGAPQIAIAKGWSGSRYSFYPIMSGHPRPLATGIKPQFYSVELEKAVISAIEQSSAVIARLRLAQEADSARMTAERESLRSALLSSLSHDLKTPLATILGSVTSLRELSGALPEAARLDLLQAIEEDARHLNNYVNNLLHMTRLQAGLDLRLDWTDPLDILNGAMTRIRKDYPQRRFEMKTTEKAPLIQTDALLVEQALCNYLDNAAKNTPVGTDIIAFLSMTDEHIRFRIVDEGPGVPAAELQRIFEPFQRGATVTSNGNGLGLAIVRGIVHALGGSAGVESPLTVQGGACFWLTLPCAKAAAP